MKSFKPFTEAHRKEEYIALMRSKSKYYHGSVITNKDSIIQRGIIRPLHDDGTPKSSIYITSSIEDVKEWMIRRFPDGEFSVFEIDVNNLTDDRLNSAWKSDLSDAVIVSYEADIPNVKHVEDYRR